MHVHFYELVVYVCTCVRGQIVYILTLVSHWISSLCIVLGCHL